VIQSKARLLVVDDEVAQMRALTDTLGLEGYAIEGFSSPRAALASLRPGEVDLLLTDLMMPEMDGIALIDAARRIDPALCAVVMTGHGTIDTAVQAMQGGALDYILKPFRLNVVLPVIARALEVQRLRRENVELQKSERRRTEELAIAYRDLEAFAYSISHDLRTPLRAIDSFGQILAEEYAAALGEEGGRLLKIIRDGSQRMDQLILGLLEFSRIGRQDFSSEPIDMTAMAKAAAEEARAVCPGPEPKIEISELPRVLGDATVLRQVWSNLIGNALKYSAKRAHPVIKISGRIEGAEAIFQVDDNGAGFDMRYAGKLFGVFKRLHRAEDFAGTGVGLAIVQRIVNRHRGRIWANGTPEVGACFQFSLPALGLSVAEKSVAEN
jgi:two-component system sensor histidine kinase/response regulator